MAGSAYGEHIYCTSSVMIKRGQYKKQIFYHAFIETGYISVLLFVIFLTGIINYYQLLLAINEGEIELIYCF